MIQFGTHWSPVGHLQEWCEGLGGFVLEGSRGWVELSVDLFLYSQSSEPLHLPDPEDHHSIGQDTHREHAAFKQPEVLGLHRVHCVMAAAPHNTHTHTTEHHVGSDPCSCMRMHTHTLLNTTLWGHLHTTTVNGTCGVTHGGGGHYTCQPKGHSLSGIVSY